MATPPFLPAGLPADPALLPTLLDLLPLGVIYYTPVLDAANTLTDLTLAYLNPAAQRMTQLPAQPATTYRQQFPTTDDNGAWEFHRQAWQASEPRQFQFYYDADGFDSFFRVTARRVGEGLLVFFTDTRDEIRSQAEQALRESQAREQAARAEAERERAQLQALLAQAPVAIGLFTGDELRVATINPRMASLLGYTPAELLGQPLFERAPELQGQGFDELMRQVRATQVPYIGQEVAATVQRHGQAQRVYFNFVYQPLYGAEGQVTGILNVAVEVTEQVQARQQVEQLNQELESRVQARTREAQQAQQLAEVQRQRLERLIWQAPAAICILTGPNLVYELVNPAYQQLFPGRALQGKPLLEALPELAGLPVWHTLQRVYQTGETHQELEMHIPVAPVEGGPREDFYFHYVQQALRDAQDTITGIIVFAFDVKGQVQARRQVQHLNEELTATNAELLDSNARLMHINTDLDTFVYTASHDLKAPIANVEGLLLALHRQLAAETAQQPLVARLLTLMQESIARFQLTIGHLTNIGQLQRAEASADVDLRALVADVQQDLASLLLTSQATLTLDLEQCPRVHCSPKTLRSVVYNLLSNAVKYRAPDRVPQVRLRCYPAPGQVVLEVQDNGLGLSPAQQAKLFRMFERQHTHVEGSGVGLYMVKRLVENAKGTIAVQSQLGVGSTFMITLPA